MWENFLIGLRKSFKEFSGIDCFIHVLYGRDVNRPGFMIEYIIPKELVDFYPSNFKEIVPSGSVHSDFCTGDCEGDEVLFE